MGKGKKKKSTKKLAPKESIQELSNSRNGGQVALRGYSYQFLYSCYLMLSLSNEDISFQLEGIEDIDCIKQKKDSDEVVHIQLKYSVNRQDASFLSSVLKNFLEAYLIDHNRKFKLVYDFPVAKGNLSRLFESNLNPDSRNYWIGVISNIQKNNPAWNWSAYDFDKFISNLSFEKVEKSTLATEIENMLIRKYDITTDNIPLFANSIKVLCLQKMEQRACVTKAELDFQIQSVKFDISKGSQNPAHSWIRKIDYSKSNLDDKHNFYEGRKATPADIASGLPVKRPSLEKAVINSIYENTVTVIKASSGQGKTTLALQTAYILQNEYIPYQLLWCNEIKDIGNTVQYFKARIQLGEKILILLDNLDNHLSKWNNLVQCLQSELHCHYKVLVTSREIDWYNYSGDLSNIHSLNIIKPDLEEGEAIEIFNRFREAKQLASGVTSWKSAWNKIAERKLLIEYVYLLTHGEMLSERVSSQISEIGQSSSGKAKCEILRKVCLADLCGVRLSIIKLYESQSEDVSSDFGELLKSMESEFLVHVDSESGYIEGLHPIRSKHIVDRLHEYFSIENTALSVIKMANQVDISILFSHLPELNINSNNFFSEVVEILWDVNDLSNYISAIQGLFAGSIMQYYRLNQSLFDDANAHGGLFIMSTEICPFTTFKDFDVSINTLDRMQEIFPDNKNVEYLCELRNKFLIYNFQKTSVYTFCECLYKKLCPLSFDVIKDIESYVFISEWIYNIDSEFNLSVNISLDNVWNIPEKLSLECISTLMFICYCGNKSVYMKFVEENLNRILTYLKHETKSHNIYIDDEEKTIHVEYILRLSDAKNGSEQSVLRLKHVCRTLPIFELYCADALKPSFSLMSMYAVPDDAHKEMPRRNIVIMFHQNLASLWNKTIMSNYEFDTVSEWLNYWFDVRECICSLADKCCACMHRLLEGKVIGSLAEDVDQLRGEFVRMTTTTGEKKYPKENRPFEENTTMPKGLEKIKSKYFQSIQNFMNQFVEFLTRDESKQQLAMFNLTMAKSWLEKMQSYFAEIAEEFDLQERQQKLCDKETQIIEHLIMCCSYYSEHSPSKFFNRFQIRDWYEKRCRNERKIVEEKLMELKSKFSIHFPDKFYTIEILRYYPIIVDNFDMTSQSNFTELFKGCVSFAEAPFDYLVILFANQSDKINPTALQISKQMFISFKNAIESEDYSLLDKLAPPYPVDVTKQMIDCFTEKKYLLEKNAVAGELPIGDIAEELWIYSKSLELLTGPEDADYLAAEIQSIQENIREQFPLLKGKIIPEDIEWLMKISDDVFAGKKFDDIMFNKVLEHFILVETEQ